MSFDLGNFLAAPSQKLLDSAKKSDLLDIADHYGLPNVKKTMLKELIVIFLFVVTEAGVVPCGIPKKRPRTLSIVQFIFYFWSFEVTRNIMRNQKTLSV